MPLPARTAVSAALAAIAGCAWLGSARPQLGADRLGPTQADESAPSSPLATEPGPTKLPSLEPTDIATDVRYPFPYFSENKLFYFDPTVMDVYPVPGAGQDIANPVFIDGDRRIVFDQDGRIQTWDRQTEVKLSLPGLEDFPGLSDPIFDASTDLLVAHNQSQVVLWWRENWPGPDLASPPSWWPTPGENASSEPVATSSPGTSAAASPGSGTTPSSRATAIPARTAAASPSSAPTSQASPAPASEASSAPSPAPTWAFFAGPTATFPAIERVAARHGGIEDANMDAYPYEVVMLANDGTLWRYWLYTGAIEEAADLAGILPITAFALAASGSVVATFSGNQAYLYDLDRQLLIPQPDASEAFDAVNLENPVWISDDEFYYLVIEHGGVARIARYNWVRESVRTMASLNGLQVPGFNLISSQARPR